MGAGPEMVVANEGGPENLTDLFLGSKGKPSTFNTYGGFIPWCHFVRRGQIEEWNKGKEK
jgi:hypothetical protein